MGQCEQVYQCKGGCGRVKLSMRGSVYVAIHGISHCLCVSACMYFCELTVIVRIVWVSVGCDSVSAASDYACHYT